MSEYLLLAFGTSFANRFSLGHISRRAVPTIPRLFPIRKCKHDNRNKETSNYGFLMRALSATNFNSIETP